MAELVTICDPAGRERGSGFVADDRGTVITAHEAVAGPGGLVLRAGGSAAGRTWEAGAADVTVLPGLALALVRTDGLGVRPLPVAVRGKVAPGTYVRLPARGWRQARVLGGARVASAAGGRRPGWPVPDGVAVELAIGTDGRDALALGGAVCGAPVLDAETGAVLAVLGTALVCASRPGVFAVALRAAAATDPGGPLAALLEHNGATVPGHGADLNLAGALELTARTCAAPLPPTLVPRPVLAAGLAAFTAGPRPVLALVGHPGTGRTTALAALTADRARGPHPAPTLWLHGADLHATDTSLADAANRALTAAEAALPASPGREDPPPRYAWWEPASGDWASALAAPPWRDDFAPGHHRAVPPTPASDDSASAWAGVAATPVRDDSPDLGDWADGGGPACGEPVSGQAAVAGSCRRDDFPARGDWADRGGAASGDAVSARAAAAASPRRDDFASEGDRAVWPAPASGESASAPAAVSARPRRDDSPDRGDWADRRGSACGDAASAQGAVAASSRRDDSLPGGEWACQRGAASGEPVCGQAAVVDSTLRSDHPAPGVRGGWRGPVSGEAVSGQVDAAGSARGGWAGQCESNFGDSAASQAALAGSSRRGDFPSWGDWAVPPGAVAGDSVAARAGLGALPRWGDRAASGAPGACERPYVTGAGGAQGFGAGVPVPLGERVARVAVGGGRGLLVVLDGVEEMAPGLARRMGEWSAATVAWLGEVGARLVVVARAEYWEGAGALYPPGALHVPVRAAAAAGGGLPPALVLGDLSAAEGEILRARLGIPAGAVAGADARHPLTLHLLAGIRAAGVTAGRPGREEVFAAHLDLLCLRTATRIAAADAPVHAPVHGPGIRRLAARVAGRVHEAARRCLGRGQGRLDRAAFEELFPRRTGWASAVLAEGLLVPAGPGYRLAHEELSDWIQGGHLDLRAALASLVHGPAAPGPLVPRHRLGPVREALRRLPEDRLREELTALVRALDALTADPADAVEADATAPERLWWAARLLRESLLGLPDARPYLPVLHALAEHVVRAGPGEFGGRFWNRLRLDEPDRLGLLRRLLPADPAVAAPGDRYLDAVARRLVRDPRRVQPLLCAWFDDGRRLRGRPGATVATAAQALLHTHRGPAVDELAEALVTAAHPRADELLAVLAEEEPSALSRAVDRWARDERPARRAAAAAHALATAPHVRTPADRDLLRRAAESLLARPADAALHGSALAVLLRDPLVRARHLPAALASFREAAPGSRLPAAALVAALPVLPDQDEVFAALRARADGEVLRALAALTTPGLARRAGELVRDHLARCPGAAPDAAYFVDRRLEQGPAAEAVVRPLVLDLLRNAPVEVRVELAAVLGAPGGEPSYPLRGELAAVLLREEADPRVLDAFLGALAAGTGGRPRARTRELLRRTGRRLLRAPGGPAVFERRTVELARAEPAFGAVVAGWLAESGGDAAALLGPGARRTVETLCGSAADVT
ncbi:hypothetical protein [Streptomyces sp. NPDC047014]|uniref:hypothetical protein n=1 Tax=Streptomyces sp. NPDC047014 TaxID=3155736 RepID=UPI0033D3AD5D